MHFNLFSTRMKSLIEILDLNSQSIFYNFYKLMLSSIAEFKQVNTCRFSGKIYRFFIENQT